MIRAAGVPFGFQADDDEIGRILAGFDDERFVVPLDGDQVVGSGGSNLYIATAPGGARLPTAGITFVTVLPTHRRRGVLRKMMRRLLDESRDRNEPLAALWASEATIYGRFGFGQAVNHIDWTLHSRGLRWRAERPEGSARLISHEDAADLIPPLHRAACSRHGMLDRSELLWNHLELLDEDWQRRGHGHRRIVVWHGESGLEGYGFYRTKVEGKGEVRVDEFHALTVDAYRGLAQFFADIDLTDEVRFVRRPVDEPLQWMIDDSRALKATGAEYMWFRLLDVPTCLEARTYAGSGTLVLEVIDTFCEPNDGRWLLTVAEGVAACAATDAAADITLDVSELGALYMGGRSALSLATAGRIRGDVAAIEELDRLFRTAVPPWSAVEF